MARTRRRSSRGAINESQEGNTNEENSETTPPDSQGAADTEPEHRDEDKCPACKEETLKDWNEEDKESWVRCDACKTWFHWRCVGEGDLEAIGKWFCQPCRDTDPKRVITSKPPARKSARKRAQRDYAGLQNNGVEQDANRWLRMMKGKTIKPDPFKRMHGNEVTIDWLENDPSAMREPIVIEEPDGLGMKMPEDITVTEIAEILGPSAPVEVIDVASQSNVPGWTLGKWAEYYEAEPAKRDKIRNVISLEISGTELADRVLPPRLVRETDWVEKFWPNIKKGRGHSYPKVQLYCLMGVADAWTDWHIDFAGSSVYYHIVRGSKVFYFIRPTPANLAAYERWSGTEMQNHSWLGDLCDEVFRVELHEGNTMIIPTGWIHAVYTPVDTLVFGGNFLHSYNISTQLKVREIEIVTHVPKKFRFPHFVKLCWYAAERYLRDLKAKEDFSPRVLESIETLADFLVAEARTMERGAESAKKIAKDEVPGDRIKDAPAVARELRWRVRLANGYASDEDSKSRRKLANGAANGSGSNGASKKRKRTEEEHDIEEAPPTFLHFKPRKWDNIVAYPSEKERKTVNAKRPEADDEGWTDMWTPPNDVNRTIEGEAIVDRRKDVVVKVRHTAKGMERQRVERILEEWVWGDKAEKANASETSVVVDTTAPVVSGSIPAAEGVNRHTTTEDVKMEENGGAH
ncbi:uncharacterized protein PHACADRAFT_209325 [Phanerochaete carnosa HHB-10118-sp]|uniref:JmjC domain-containing histone demethylation protein 1 n=1 Tax=Phanerochaete carnosa (strain HHB-10118-sp) TaxID=650164 RepID=K5W9F3_PHACS|nr:uncharacterized protein PHACADRAFT_209325 [Phanerochaete carnosa HHB-10118-sp]EKM55800.1 hypothetical protein PHACADRAFT_209325 [Phanerochaete carnosa HHB-10118-sp]